MGKVIAVANQKGGVGKTTSVINLTAALGKAGKKCLLVDVDSQGNSTSGLGINKREVECSVYDLLVGDGRASEAILKTQFKNVDLIPSSIDLAAAEVELAESQDRTLKLRQSLAAIRDQYDYILIDCPPSMGLVTLNAFSACDTVIIPIQCEYYALEGLSQLTATIRQVKRLYNPVIELEGILLTMYDGRLRLTEQVEAEVRKHFPDKVYDTVIPRNVRLSEAPSFGMPAIYFDASSRGAKAYTALCKEFLKKNRAKKK
ncbi:AAA family ATPase [uncultured Negativibacillus sp.]|uniref:ParA family protein n=1 Tax=uncultured Negativibacillus sp. TaxID=1980696 RepID=UPI0025EF1E8F|nr:AAA family ATPase [uncultured Negativibacillus sp.]